MSKQMLKLFKWALTLKNSLPCCKILDFSLNVEENYFGLAFPLTVASLRIIWHSDTFYYLNATLMLLSAQEEHNILTFSCLIPSC